MTPMQLTGALFFVIGVVVFTWLGLTLVVKPKEWLERNGRSTAANHIRATRLIGGIFLAGGVLSLWQLLRRP